MQQAPRVYVKRRKRRGRRGGFYYVLRWYGPAPCAVFRDGEQIRQRGEYVHNYERLNTDQRRVAEQYRRDKERELADGIMGKIQAMTWPDFQAEYLAHLRSLARRPNHVTTVELRLGKFAATMGLEDIRQVDRRTVEVYRFGRKAETRQGRPLSAHTVNNQLATIHAALAFGVKQGYLPENPAVGVEWLAADRPAANPMTPDEALAAISAAEHEADPQWLRFTYLVLTTGARKMELCGLDWADVDLDDGRICLRGDATKTREGRDLPLDAYAVLLLLKVPTIRRRGPVFRKGDGTAWRGNINDGWRRIMRRAGLVHEHDDAGRGWKKGEPRFTIHDCRDTFNSLAKEYGALPEIVEAVMGHRPQGVNRRHYTKYTMGALRNAQACLPYLRSAG